MLTNTAKFLAFEEGKSEGISQGEKQSKIEIAKKFLLFDIPIEKIAEGTDLPAEEIENLKKEMIQTC